ncbi:MAG: hypothetical protein A2017_05380 [Lentisphaerae bacterium GWF2_44_16]|nr:MAG: hypothetical protein A2017_05380 [Lentisphaerae bacterium GWF2_44_16]
MRLQNILPAGFSALKSFFSRRINRALASITSVAENIPKYHDGLKTEKISKDIFFLLAVVLRADGRQKERIPEIENYLSEKYSEVEAEKIISILEDKEDPDIEKSASRLSKLSEKEKLSVLSALIDVAYCDGEYSKKQRKVIENISEKLKVPRELFKEIENSFVQEKEKREKILRSGAGVVMALIVIVIFVLTATFLKSVLFGLVLAYFFLPLEKWYEKNFFSNRLVISAGNLFSYILRPLSGIPGKMKEAFGNEASGKTSSEDILRAEKEKLVMKSSAATVFTFFLIILLLIFLVTSFSLSYVTEIGSSVKDWADRSVITEQNVSTEKENGEQSSGQMKMNGEYMKSLFMASVRKVESLRPELEKLTWFKKGVENVKGYIKDEKNRELILSTLINKSGGVFSYTAGFVSNVFYFLLNIILTVFFFSLFLQKLAFFNSLGTKIQEPGEYLVKSIFGSGWMPNTSIETREEARIILDTVFGKLKAWVKGYMTIILTESFIYITCFIIIGVPYAPILGFIAGCTILLPFIGPVSSALLTVTVCFAGGASMLTVLIAVITYFLVTGILDQLFLYPKFVGGALGLSTLETITVVLLGGLFGGLAGMIFAVPTASVLKYLIPKIYQCWQQ